jgi:hypothetical protein
MFRARRVAAAFPARKACSRQDTLPLAREECDQDADDWDRDAELGFHSALEIRRVSHERHLGPSKVRPSAHRTLSAVELGRGVLFDRNKAVPDCLCQLNLLQKSPP